MRPEQLQRQRLHDAEQSEQHGGKMFLGTVAHRVHAAILLQMRLSGLRVPFDYAFGPRLTLDRHDTEWMSSGCDHDPPTLHFFSSSGAELL